MKKGGRKSPLGSRLAKVGSISHAGKQTGFTILETLIVLAVTGSMLLIAMYFVSGRQNKTEFQTSINTLQQQLQQVINQTVSGHYNNNGNFSCSGVGSLVVISAGAKGQGTNESCIFLGNVLQFGTGTGDAASTLGIIPIVGRQYSTGLQSVNDIGTAKPRALYPLGGEVAPTDAVTTTDMKYGLTVAASSSACSSGGMCYDRVLDNAQIPAGSIGFISGDSQGNLAPPDGGSYKAGSQQFTLYGVKGTLPTKDTPTVAKAIGNFADVPVPAPQGLEAAKEVRICIASGTTEDSGLFKITADLHVTLKIFKGVTC